MNYFHHYYKGNLWLFCCSVEGAIWLFITYKIQSFNIPLKVCSNQKINTCLKIPANLFSSACLSSLNTYFQRYAYPPLKTGLCTPWRIFLLCLFSNWSWLLQIFSRCFRSTYIYSPCKNIINIPQNSVCGTEQRNKRWGASHRAQAAAGCLQIHSSKPASLPTTTDLLHVEL